MESSFVDYADLHGAMAAMDRLGAEIAALAEHGAEGGPVAAKTARGTPYVAFSDGERRTEGQQTAPYTGTLDELVASTLEAVKAYRAEVDGPARLIWRQKPMYERDSQLGTHSIWLRLAFERAAEHDVTPAPALATVATIDEPDQDIIKACETLLSMAVSGELRALAFVSIKKGGYVGTAWHYGAAPSYHQLLSGATRLQHRLADDAQAE